MSIVVDQMTLLDMVFEFSTCFTDTQPLKAAFTHKDLQPSCATGEVWLGIMYAWMERRIQSGMTWQWRQDKDTKREKKNSTKHFFPCEVQIFPIDGPEHVTNMCVCSYLNIQVNKHTLQTIGCFGGGDPSPSAVQEEGTARLGSTCICPGPQSPALTLHPATTVQWTEGGRGKMDSMPVTVVCFQLQSNVKKVLTNLWLWPRYLQYILTLWNETYNVQQCYKQS